MPKDAVTSIHERFLTDNVIQNTSVRARQSMSFVGTISELDDDRIGYVLTRDWRFRQASRVLNETPLCRVIHKTETPVVVGVGHENDRTLADEVADRRVMTPTEAGNIVPERTTLEAELETLEERLNTAYTETAETTLETMDDRLTRAYRRTVESDLSAFEAELDRTYDTHVRDELTDLANRLEQARTQYDQQREREQEVAAHRRQRRRLLLILVALGLLVVALLPYIRSAATRQSPYWTADSIRLSNSSKTETSRWNERTNSMLRARNWLLSWNRASCWGWRGY